MSDALPPLLYSLHDSLMQLAPAGWTTINLQLKPVDGALRLTELSTKGLGVNEPRPKPELKLDTKAEAERLSEGFAELAEVLSEGGKQWTSGRAQLERNKDATDFRLLRDDGGILWFHRLLRSETDQLIITDDLFDALWGTERAFVDLQARFEARVEAGTTLEFDLPKGLLHVGDKTLEAVVIGHSMPEAFAWLWSWADEAVPDAASARVAKICQPELQPPGLSAFWRPNLHIDEGLIWALCSHVVVSLGARGLVRVALADGTAAFLAVMAEP